ncbi:MAG TPA: hypothetical protein VNJ53_02475 [Gaiellaceae bacterium]|nr:hypothetical protein [Gaiellaceae bacterium]
MRQTSLASATRGLVLALSLLYLTAAAAGALWIDFDTTRDLVFWLVFLCAGAALMLAGQLALPVSTWPSALLVSLGAAAGGLPLFWTILVPIAAATVMACSIALARAGSGSAPAA